MPPSDFDHYPKPTPSPETGYEPPSFKPLVLRGLPLFAVAEIVSRSAALQRILWTVGGWCQVKTSPATDDLPYTFHPLVTPLGPSAPMLPPDPTDLGPAHATSPARYYTAADYHALYRSGKVTPTQVTTALLALAAHRRADGSPGRLADCWADSHGADRLAVEAARLSTERYAAGAPLGVLDGVPVGVKDDVAVRGYVCHDGMGYKDSLPCFKEREETAWPVRMLQEAGAVVVGKLRMHEAGVSTSGLNTVQGTPTNHFNDSYYPGGSSSGPASALSVGLTPICIATDAGGSIRIPAAYNSLYGLKTTHQRTLTMGVTMCVTGPMAANVADLRLAYRFMSQPNPDCPVQSRFGLSIPPEPSAPRVMGVYRDWWKHADSRVSAACDGALEWFAAERGYRIVDISIPHLADIQIAHASSCSAELADTFRRRYSSEWPSLPGSATKLTLAMACQTPAADYLEANRWRTLLMRHLAFLFQQHPGLLIMTPTSPWIGYPKTPGDESYGVCDASRTISSMMFVCVANMSGTPSLSAPIAYVDPDQGQGRVPVGLMATAEWGAEEQLLSWASDAEHYLHKVNPDGRRRPDSWVDVFELASREPE